MSEIEMFLKIENSLAFEVENYFQLACNRPIEVLDRVDANKELRINVGQFYCGQNKPTEASV